MKPISCLLFVAFTCLFTCLFTTLLHADHPVAPDGATVEGGTGGFFGSALTSQQLYVPADLTGLNVGDVITGISFRLDTASGPFTTTTFARFDVRMGAGQGSLTSTLANNFAGPVTVVRSGELVLGGTTFPSGSGPNSFGAVIRFDTPYAYAGGNLLMEVRSGQPSPIFTIDALTDTEGVNGQSAFGNGADETTASIGIFPHNWAVAFEVTRAGAVPERLVIPDGAAGEGNVSGNFNHAGGLAGHMNYLPAQLDSLKPGDRIAGIAFRLNNAVTGFRSTTFSRFDIRMGRGSAAYSTTGGTAFAANFASAPGLVRSGPMTLYLTSISGNPNPFATRPILFDTPHTYTGGALLFETRTSSQTTPFIIDSFNVAGYGGGLFKNGDLDALVGDVDNSGANWALELHVLRDKTAPRIAFTGKPKLMGGRARVTGSVREAGTVATIRFISSSRQRGAAAATKAVQPFSFAIRSLKAGSPVTVTVTATDASGNKSMARRVYRP